MTIAQRLTLSAVLVILLSAAAIAYAVNLSIQGSLTHVEQQTQQALADRLAATLSGQVVGSGEDVKAVLAAAPITEIMVAVDAGGQPPAGAMTQALRLFSAEVAARPRYLQIRAIGAANSGRELLRVEHGPAAGTARIVPDDQLQSKGARPYFIETMKLSPGEVYVSPIELNQEHGQIQTPHLPVIRAATPVVDAEGRAIGIVVINVDMRRSLASLRAVNEDSRIYLIDDSGRYLLHADPAKDFAFELGSAPRMQDDFPSLAALATSTRPSSQTIRTKTERELVVAAAPVLLQGGRRVVIVAMRPSSGAAASANATRAIFGAALAAALVGALAAFLLARSVSRPLSQVTEAARGFLEEGDLRLPVKRVGEVGVLADTLERMHLQLRERGAAQERLAAIITSTDDAILSKTLDGVITSWNRGAEKLFGYTEQEAVGQTTALIVPDGKRQEEDDLLARIARGERVANSETLRRRKQGGEVEVSVSLSPLRDGKGEIIGASSICRDITELKRQEMDLRRSNAELEQFAYVASHDLQEPLRMVASFTDLLEKRYAGQLDERADKYIQFASDGARRMQQLVADLLAYSRVGSEGKAFAAVNTARVVADIASIFAEPIKQHGVVLSVGDLPVVLGDEGQLRQLFQNLIGNAIKFRGDAPLRIEVSAERLGPRWRFKVSDNGIGMDMKHVKRIFDMFQRLHARGKFEGSGIGLAISKRIVERHGGTIGVEATPGNGATFVFTLQAEAAAG